MKEAEPDPQLAALLTEYESAGGRLDFVFLVPDSNTSTESHRLAALAGIAAIDRRLGQHAAKWASEEHPIDLFFRLRWDESRLVGGPVPHSVFWGTDDVEPKRITRDAYSIPDINGYKPAFFHPPHGLGGSMRENAELFEKINTCVFGDAPDRAEIFSWSTDWSNYFDDGHEWWGAFFWTIRPFGSQKLVVIAASTTD